MRWVYSQSMASGVANYVTPTTTLPATTDHTQYPQSPSALKRRSAGSWSYPCTLLVLVAKKMNREGMSYPPAPLGHHVCCVAIRGYDVVTARSRIAF